MDIPISIGMDDCDVSTLPLVTRFIRPLPIGHQYGQRLKQELDLIHRKGFVRCFKQVADIVEYSRNQGIPHLLRGSGASSLVSYMLGITNIDPVKENINLARFMNDHRNDQPDIDIDYPHWIRDSIMDEVRRQYPHRVARISNDVKYKEKSALREILRRYGIKKVPKYFKLKDYVKDPQMRKQIELEAKELIGEHRYWSLHCGGIIIFDDSIPEDLLYKDNQILMTKYDVDEQNLIKIDLLCNRGLSQLWEMSDKPLHEYPFEDEKIADLLASGDVIGLTQAESRTMKKTFQALKPKNYKEVALALALIRPAVADNGRKSAYFKDPQNQKMIIYDDDSISYIAEMVGCSMGEADKFRRGFKKGRSNVIGEFLERSRGKLDENSTQFKQLEESNKYSFCKGHALAYGQMVWALAFHKVYNRKKFWASTLKHCKSSYRKWVHKSEGQNAGVSLVHPYSNELPTYQFLKTGWWVGSFPSDCYLREVEEGVYEFRGLIASKRNVRKNGGYIRLITIGYDTGKYIDLIVTDKAWVRHNEVIKGKGLMVTSHGSSYLTVQSMKYEPYKLSDFERQLTLF